MPSNTNILMIRHAEKPTSGTSVDLTAAGQARAQAYIIYFQNYVLGTAGSGPLKLDYLFAAADTDHSQRPVQTITPLAQTLGKQIDAKHKDKDYQQVVDDILQNSKYDGKNILICWHHEQILCLAAALGVDVKQLPLGANWPTPTWPGQVYGWVLQLCFNSQGKIDPTRTLCQSERLMFDDNGQNPPSGQ